MERLDDETGRLGALRRMAPREARDPRLERFAELVKNALDVPIAAVTLIEEREQCILASAGGPISGAPREAAFCARTIRRHEVLSVEDAATDPRFRDNPYVTGEPGIRAYLGAPLVTPDGYALGALCAIDLRPRSFGEAEAALLKSVARLVASALVEAAPDRDPLSGLLGRAAWEAAAEAEIDRASEGGASALVLAEVRALSAINAKHGAQAGDEAIRNVGAALAAAAGPGAKVGRVAGDAFAAVLPGAHGTVGLEVAESAAAELRAMRSILAPDLRPAADFGVAELVPAIETPELWLSVAELSLAFRRRGGEEESEAAA